MSKDAEIPAFDLLGDPLPEPVPAERRNVKRDQTRLVDEHERSHRDFLTESETIRLLTSARAGRFGVRDYIMLLLAYRHGLRVSELISIRIADIDVDASRIWVKRIKEGLSKIQPLQGDELRGLRAYLRTRKDHLPW